MKCMVMQVCILLILPVLTHALMDQDIQAFVEDHCEGTLLIHVSLPESFGLHISNILRRCDGVMFYGCAKRVLSNLVSAMNSMVTYFLTKYITSRVPCSTTSLPAPFFT